jgi:hypothetical protein
MAWAAMVDATFPGRPLIMMLTGFIVFPLFFVLTTDPTFRPTQPI